MRMPPAPIVARRSLLLAGLLLTGACFDASVSPTSLVPASVNIESRIDCVGNVVSRSVACAPAAAATVVQTDRRTGERFALAGPLHDVILGNQGGYVKLTSSNISVAGGVFSFDVTLQNKIAQPIGTTNGFSAAAAGSRVFFAVGPTVTGGTGAIDF